jgi:hypothetical protein
MKTAMSIPDYNAFPDLPAISAATAAASSPKP